MTEQHLFLGDSKIELKIVENNSIDFLLTDPPYGYSFMGKDWDKVLPDQEIWNECFRVLKEGSFICVMASPRSDVLWRLCRDLEGSGFDLSFSNIEWVYHTGFPKAGDTSKMIDKRLGVDREVIGKKEGERYKYEFNHGANNGNIGIGDASTITSSNTDLGKKYEGSKLGFQPKPAREIIVVGMKPFKEKSYIDKVLNFEELPENIQRTYPLIQTPKPSKKEKDMGLTGEEKLLNYGLNSGKKTNNSNGKDYTIPSRKNNHPTVKPVKLMSYLITLFTREGDYVLDPFMGSGTTGLASKLLNRNFIGIDFTEEYFDISNERLQISREEIIKQLKIQTQYELF